MIIISEKQMMMMMMMMDHKKRRQNYKDKQRETGKANETQRERKRG